MAAALCHPSLDGLPGSTGEGDGPRSITTPAADGSKTYSRGSVHPIHFLYGHLHDSIRTELDNLSNWVLALEADNEQDLQQRLQHLKERYHFLEQVYKYHSSVEDEVVYPALDSKVKNVTAGYSVEHQDEEYLFEHLGSLLSAAVAQTGAERTATIRELICKVAEIHITLRKHLAKEEAQLLPLLLQHFSAAEQAELVAQFLYCIPLDTVERVLSWLKPTVPLQELQELMAHLRDVIPDRLLLQLLVTWLNPAPPPRVPAAALPAGTAATAAALATAASLASSSSDGGAHAAAVAAAAAAAAAADVANKTGQERMVICPFAAGASKQQALHSAAAGAAAAGTAAAAAGSEQGQKQWPPLRAIVLFHHAVRGAMEVFASEAAALQQQPGVSASQLAGLVERHRFLRSVCMFHTQSEEDVMFPEVLRINSGTRGPEQEQLDTVLAACTTCQDEHTSEITLFENMGRLLAEVRAYVRRGRTRDVPGMLGKLVETSNRVCAAISTHMQREEAEVLPLLAAALGAAEQRGIVWHTLRAMPLRLLERVLPWLFSELSDEDAEGMMTNLRLGAPLVDQQLVELLLRWAQRGRWPVLPDVVVAGAAAAAAAGAACGSGGAAAAAAAEATAATEEGDMSDEQQQVGGERAVPQQPAAADDTSCALNAAVGGAAAGAAVEQQAGQAVHEQQRQQAQELGLTGQLRQHRQGSPSWASYDPCLFGNNTCELRLLNQSNGSGSSPRKRPRLDGQGSSPPESSSADATPTAAAAGSSGALDELAGAAGSAAQGVLADAGQALAAAAAGAVAVRVAAGAHACADAGAATNISSPIDHIFQFHKALRRELKQLESDAAALEVVVLAACEQHEQTLGHAQQQTQPPPQQQQQQEPSGAGQPAQAPAQRCPAAAAVLGHSSHELQQLDGRFTFLWGIYRAHSKAEDEIVFPALESKEALHNVSRAYSLDHEQEEQLFHNLSAVLQRMRVAASVTEARDLALQLRRMCAAVRASLETHVRAEEAELWPLFSEHFSVQEQQHLVGIIIGRTGAEVLQALLPWVTGAFSTEEKEAMMDSLREATKNTMFDQWLDAVQGGNGSDTGTPRLAPPSASSAAAAAAAAGAGEVPGAQQQPQQQQQVDAHMQLAEIAGYLADGDDTASAVGAAFGGSAAAAAAAAPGLSAAGLHQHHQQQHQQQLTLQQQTEVSGTVAESTNYVPGWEDIFNINQKQLEGAIRRVSNDPNLEPQRKAYLIQNIMVSRYIVAQQRRMRTRGSLTAAGSAAIAAAAAAAAGGGDGAAAAAAAGGPSHSHGAGCCHHHHGHQQQFGPVMHQHQLLQPPAPVATRPRQALAPSSSGCVSDAAAGAGASSAAAAAAAAGGGTAAGGSVARQTYTDAFSGILGCQHYRRATRLVAPCCDQVFTCRLCHDDASDHRLDRYAVSEMECMLCGTRQPVAGTCTSCNTKLASYYCGICHLWDDEPGRAIYHCPFCNVCRRGQGLGIDFFHCMQCNACMSLSLFNTHTCRERAMEGNCPVCHEYLFDSATPIKELPCGHFLHSSCFADYARYSYTCPICCKSIGDMSMYFQMLDSLLATERHRLPAEYANKKQSVLCQDCGKVGMAPYHWVYHACPHCKSYNTRMM